MDSEDDVNEFRLDDQLANENNDDMDSENVIQKKNLGISHKEYKILINTVILNNNELKLKV